MTESKQLLLVLLFLFLLEVFDTLSVRKEAVDVFPPKIGWRLFYFFMIASFSFELIQYLGGMPSTPKSSPVWFCVLFVLALLLMRPRTIAGNSTGLSSFSIYGFRHSFIPWTQVSSVTSDWREDGGRFPLALISRGYSVTVAGRDGTGIEHTFYQSHQGKFLDELRQHVPAAAFAPGLFDWHP